MFGTSLSAYAQQQPRPPDEQQPAVVPRSWRLDLTAGVGYDDNLRFTPVMESAAFGRLRAGLTRRFGSTRRNASLRATGDGGVYRPLSQYNRVNYSADLTANYLLSPRTTLRVADSFSKNYTSDSRALIEAGLFLPRSVVRSNDASVEVSHDISPRWTWSVLAQHRVAHFESNLLIEESSFGGRADLSWLAGSDSRVGLNYELSHTDRKVVPDSDLHRVALWGQRSFGERVTFRLDVGASKFHSQGRGAGRVVPSGSAQFDVRSAKQSLSATVLRSTTEAIGLGREQVRSATSLRFTRTLTHRLTAGASGTLNRSEDPGRDPSRTFDTKSVSGDFGVRLALNVELSLSGGYRKLDFGVASARSRFATLALKVGENW